MTVRTIYEHVAVVANDKPDPNDPGPTMSQFENKEAYDLACLTRMCEYTVYSVIMGPDDESLDQIIIGFIKKTPSCWAFLPKRENNWALYPSSVMSDISNTLSMLEQDEEVAH